MFLISLLCKCNASLMFINRLKTRYVKFEFMYSMLLLHHITFITMPDMADTIK